MGMFDSLIDKAGYEWQTKAYDCELVRYHIGDKVPPLSETSFPPDEYQVEVLGGPGSGDHEAYATVRNRILVEVPSVRNLNLTAADYSGYIGGY